MNWIICHDCGEPVREDLVRYVESEVAPERSLSNKLCGCCEQERIAEFVLKQEAHRCTDMCQPIANPLGALGQFGG